MVSAPIAYPSTRAITGFRQPRNAWYSRSHLSSKASAPAAAEIVRALSVATSPPAEKARSPAPVNTITPTWPSSAARATASVSSTSVSGVNALSFSPG